MNEADRLASGAELNSPLPYAMGSSLEDAPEEWSVELDTLLYGDEYGDYLNPDAAQTPTDQQFEEGLVVDVPFVNVPLVNVPLVNVPSAGESLASQSLAPSVTPAPHEPLTSEALTGEALPNNALPNNVLPNNALPNDTLALALVGSEDAGPSYQELFEQNRALLVCLADLEASLDECQQNFQTHLDQYHLQEQLLSQRDRDVHALEIQAKRTHQDLEEARRQFQRQEILIETLQNQLGSSQERVAQLERDCTLAQKRYAEQAQQLVQAEGLCRDFKSRLHRQQRYTLQFKGALERCLDITVSPHSFDLPDINVEPVDEADDFFPRSKPVQPWSAAGALETGDLGLEAELGDAVGGAESVFDPTAADDLEGMLRAELEALSHHSVLVDEVDADLLDADLLEPALRDGGIQERDPMPQYALECATSTPFFEPVSEGGPDGLAAEQLSPGGAIPGEPMPVLNLPSWGAIAQPGAAAASLQNHELSDPWGESTAEYQLNSSGLAEPTPSESQRSESQPSEQTPVEPKTKTQAEDTSTSQPFMSLVDERLGVWIENPEAAIAALNLQSTGPSPVLHPLRTGRRRLTSLAAIDLPSFPKAPV